MINLRIQPPETKTTTLAPRITVVGVGGAGNNAVNNMIASGLDGVEFLVCNTDAQALSGARANRKIQLGTAVTGGLGAGAKPEVGRAAAEESIDELMQYIDGANMVFITAGMGGGTGTGAAPVIAKACKELGILTVGVVTKPFHFEGTMRMKSAEAGIQDMQQYVDTLIVIPNQNLFRIANEKTTFADSFKLADAVLQSAVRGVTDLMVMPGLVNLDFADIKTTMTEMGKAMMGTGEASGDRRAVLASEAAINNPLLDDVTMKGARGVIINIAGGQDMTLFEVDEACNRIREEVDPDANIIFGTSVDDSLGGALRVTVLATGIETMADKKARTEDKSQRRVNAVAGTGMMPRTQSTYEQARQAASAAAATARTYAAPQPQPVEADDVEVDLHQAAAMRAPAAPVRAQVQQAQYVQNDTFIPPQPVEAMPESAGTVSYSQIAAGVAAPRVQAEPQYVEEYVEDVVEVAVQYPQQAPAVDVGIPAGIAPVAGAGLQPQPRRQVAPETATASASLFERITKRVRQTLEGTPETVYAQQPVQPQYAPVRGGAQPAVTSQPIPQHAAAQPVDVARPAKPATPQAELDLEIPAFLRRQAS